MFNFSAPAAKAVYLDPTMGSVLSAPPSTSSTGTTPAAVTTAVATSPQGGTVYSSQFTLSGTASISADGKPLTYQWTLGPGSPSAAILGANTATPTMQAAQGTGLYSFVLTVTDDTGKTATATVTVQYYAP
jgi:hypothetical protein